MVYKVAGYIASYDQIRSWAHRNGREPPAYGVSAWLDKWFKERRVDNAFRALGVNWPQGTPENPEAANPVIMLVRKSELDPNSTRRKWVAVKEGDGDRLVKNWLEDEGLHVYWATIPDPYQETEY